MQVDPHQVKEIVNSENFKSLVSKRLKVSLTLTFLILLVYFGFILLIAFYKDVLAINLGSNITLGLPVGIGIIIFAWILTGIYTRWANQSYDKSVKEIKEKVVQK